MNIYSDCGCIGSIVAIDNRVVEAVFADKASGRGVIKGAVSSHDHCSAIYGTEGGACGNSCTGAVQSALYNNNITVRISIVAKQRARYSERRRVVGSRFKIVVLSERWRVGWVRTWINHINGEYFGGTVAAFITDLNGYGIFADKVSGRCVYVSTVGVDDQLTPLIGS